MCCSPSDSTRTKLQATAITGLQHTLKRVKGAEIKNEALCALGKQTGELAFR